MHHQIVVNNIVINIDSLGIVQKSSGTSEPDSFLLTATCNRVNMEEHKKVTCIMSSHFKEFLEVVKKALVEYSETHEVGGYIDTVIPPVEEEGPYRGTIMYE